MKGTNSVGIIRHDLAASMKFVLVSDKTFQTHGASGVELTGTDADFCSESITVSICKTGGTVMIDPSRVHQIHEGVSCL